MQVTADARERTLRSVMDQVKEGELKLGYSHGTVRLYYVPESLCALLGWEPVEAEALAERLNRCGAFAQTELGDLAFAVRQGRVEVSVPPEGAAFVHERVEASAFLRELIELFRDPHACRLEAVRALFARHDPGYAFEAMPEGGEFQYLLYFPDGEVDPYYYCVADEMGHLTYHRFAKPDFLALTAGKGDSEESE